MEYVISKSMTIFESFYKIFLRDKREMESENIMFQKEIVIYS